MLAQAVALGCTAGAGDINCLCEKPAFQFGVHDCAYQHCAPDTTAAASAVNWGSSYCAAATSGLTTTVSNLSPTTASSADANNSTPRPRLLPR